MEILLLIIERDPVMLFANKLNIDAEILALDDGDVQLWLDENYPVKDGKTVLHVIRS